ncbi:PasA protein [Pseudomonas stutzeri]|nr:PasA protein [Stutzerimonas stutzeri]
MAHELYTRTNQKIFFAGLSLESWRKAEETASMNSQGLIQAEREACLFHLYGALLGLCHEIAGYYRSPGADAPVVEAFLTRSVLEAAPSPELAELLELSEQPGTWLGQLLAAYRQLFQPPRAPAKAKTDPRQPLIEAVTVEDETPPLTRAELEAWRQNLKGLALRFRESLTEW